MLNARLYRTSWLVAGVALVVALLTLQRPATAPPPSAPPAFDGVAAFRLWSELATLSPRPPGSPADLRSARLVRDLLAQVPGARTARGGSRVQVQEFSARADGATYRLRNVYLALPASGEGALERGVLVVAPRDTPPGVSGGASSSAVMIELARLAGTMAHHRPLLFVSSDGSTLGNAGIRWFLSRFSDVPLAAAVVLDAPGEARGSRIDLWEMGRDGRQASGLAHFAADAVERVGGRPVLQEEIARQVMGMAVPQTFGEQGPIVASGLPAVTLSARRESPLPERPPFVAARQRPTPDRLTLVGNAAQGLLGSMDAADTLPAPDRSLVLAGRVLRPTIARIALLLLALPLLVAAADALARVGRGRVSLVPGLRSLWWRGVPLATALVAAWLLVQAGVLPGTAAGTTPLPDAVPFDAVSAAGGLGAVAAGVLVWLLLARRLSRADVTPPAQATAALVALAALVVVVWLWSPFALAVALPAAHAALVATVVPRRWQVALLAVVAVIPAIVLAVSVGGVLDRNPLYAIWYLLETSASGARGLGGPVAAVAVAVAVWALGAMVVFRARKGLVPAGGAREPRAREAVSPARSESR
jgi:hypothetical protein